MKCKVSKRLCPASVRVSYFTCDSWFFGSFFGWFLAYFLAWFLRCLLNCCVSERKRFFKFFFLHLSFLWFPLRFLRTDAISFPVRVLRTAAISSSMRFLRWCDFLSRAVATAMRWTALRARILEQLPLPPREYCSSSIYNNWIITLYKQDLIRNSCKRKRLHY